MNYRRLAGFPVSAIFFNNLGLDPIIRKIEVLFLLGEYYRRIGEPEKAREYFGLVKISKYKDKDGKVKIGHPYFIGLVQDRENAKKEKASTNRNSGPKIPRQ